MTLNYCSDADGIQQNVLPLHRFTLGLHYIAEKNKGGYLWKKKKFFGENNVICESRSNGNQTNGKVI